MASRRPLASRAMRSGTCLLWTGPLDPRGYAVAGAWIDGEKVQGAHRIMWMQRNNCKPQGPLRNTCGRLHCINPDHWKDARPSGSRMRERKAEIARLFQSGMGIGEIADRVGCSRTTVWRWKGGLSIAGPIEASEGTDGSGDGGLDAAGD